MTGARRNGEAFKGIQAGPGPLRIITLRMSEDDHQQLMERTAKSGARTPSEYMREASEMLSTGSPGFD